MLEVTPTLYALKTVAICIVHNHLACLYQLPMFIGILVEAFSIRIASAKGSKIKANLRMEKQLQKRGAGEKGKILLKLTVGCWNRSIQASGCQLQNSPGNRSHGSQRLASTSRKIGKAHGLQEGYFLVVPYSTSSIWQRPKLAELQPSQP